MTLEAPLLIVTLPGRTVEEVLEQVTTAQDGGADVAEVRLDRWSAAERARAPALFPSRLPLMATFRSRAEGGEGPDAPEERTAILQEAVRLPFRWVDLEEARDAAIVESFPVDADVVRVLSAHLPEGTSPSDLVRRLRAKAPAGTLRKLVLPATVGELLQEILPSLRAAGMGSGVVLTTGPSGALMRAWSMRLRYPFVFASLPEIPAAGAAPAVEPSQIPVDRLRYFFDRGDVGALFALVGHPVAHSRSPFLHSRWMRAANHPGLYLSLDIVSETEFVESLEPLVAGGFRGLNVTHPWKSSALASATRVGRGAEVCGAANCLSFRDDEIEAENTDLAAVLRRLEELRRSGTWDGEELAVIGAGGAAAATLAAARELATSAFLVARSPARATELARRLGATPLSRSDARPFSLVVHATDVGREGTGPLDAPLAELVGPESQVLDWVYSPADPGVRKVTEAAGGQYEDGWRLLVYQAAASFGIWWGAEPLPDDVDRAIEEGPCMA